ncbi:MAG: maleylpyruvate isomerase N-terminal domain-containing protein [Actinomycetota bacterium]|nr:maleylpyruvate isomerase N-terminal domain-containing protein [Actinomycetota bacterium]
MPAALARTGYLATIRQAGDRLLATALAAGFTAPVPTCPTWTVAHLVAHQAMVHRWAAAHVAGGDPDAVPSQTELRARTDLAEYYAEGLGMLTAALAGAPDDLQAMTFLNDVTTPVLFWARRQTHETTIHSVDALSARLGRVPTTHECAIDPGLATDGLDELLRGFFTRGKSKMFDGDEYAFVVAASDVPAAWEVRVGQHLTVAAPRQETASAPDEARMRLTGTAAGLYLALWNRGNDVQATGDATVLARWHREQRIRWS